PGAPGVGAPRSGVRGGVPPARSRLSRPPLDAQGARRLPPGAAAESEEAAIPGSRALPLRRLRLAAPRRARRRRGLVQEGGGVPRPREPEAGALLLPPRPRPRSREPDAAHVLRPALPAPEPQPGDRGRHQEGPGSESR